MKKYAIVIAPATKAPNRINGRVILPARFDTLAEAQEEYKRLTAGNPQHFYVTIELSKN